jgi:hypothetical protein
MPSEAWPIAYRRVHLAGGLHAENGIQERRVHFVPTVEGSPASFDIDSYHSITSDLRQCGHQIIGIEYVEHELQANGHIPTTWRPYHQSLGGDRAAAVEEHWADLATSGRDQDIFEFVDISRRINFQIQTSSRRLRDLSMAYHTELAVLAAEGNFAAGKRINTMNTFAIEISAHSLLSELATLRDYLAEFLATFVLAELRADEEHIRTMAGLRSKVLPSLKGDHAIVPYVQEITSKTGWLKNLSDYRDLAVHYTPLMSAERMEFVEMQLRLGFEHAVFPAIYFGLPADPAAIKISRSKPGQRTSYKEWIRNNRERSNGPDTLLYCHEALGNMIYLAKRIADYSPFPPRKMKFDSSNSRNFRIHSKSE